MKKGIFLPYLFGEDAATGVRTDPNMVVFFLGDPTSKILVVDHRQHMVEVTRQILDGTEPDVSIFANRFSELAKVTISDLPNENVRIDIFPVRIRKTSLPRSLLYLAVINVGGYIPATPIFWRHVSIGNNRLAVVDLYPAE